MKIEELLSLIPEFKEFQESSLILEGKEAAYHNSLILKDNSCLGTGFSLDKAMARQIALSEAIERRVVSNLYKSPTAKSYLLDEYPSTCGFAIGLGKESTIERAKAEAVERWLRSKWIDDGYRLDQFKVSPESLSPVEAWFVEQFQDVLYFTHSCYLDDDVEQAAHSVIVVGLTDCGAFVGSKTMMNKKVPLLPALVEAWRHLRISTSTLDTNESKVIHHYSQHKDSALAQIEKAVHENMPSPALRLLKRVEIPIEGFIGYRALCKDFIGWHGANLDRFVY